MSTDFAGGPGFLAFVVTFAMVAAGVLLFFSLSRHLRKVRVRQAAEARQAAEDARAREAAADDGIVAQDDAPMEDAPGDDAPRDDAPGSGPRPGGV